MSGLWARLQGGRWGLARARLIAAEVLGRRAEARALVRVLFGDDVELRKRAADVARRITDLDPRCLEAFTDEIAGLLGALPPEESRTRWHLGLVVARTARTGAQRLRAARMMLVLAADESNVVRCSAVEGLALLAGAEPSLREEAEAMIESFLQTGTAAMKCRAHHAQRLLDRKPRRHDRAIAEPLSPVQSRA